MTFFTSLLIYFAVSLGSLYLLWIFYLAVMNLKRVRDEGKLHGIAYALGLPILYVGLLLDVFVNWVLMTVVFLEFPKETLVTSRLKRHWKTAPNSWRGKFARKFSNIMLDEFDDGDHLD